MRNCALAFGVMVFQLFAHEALCAQALRLPSFTITDCMGTRYSDADFTKRGAVLVVTAPTQAQGEAQKNCDRFLGPYPWSTNGPFYAFLQDFSQSWFQRIALTEMRRRYDPPPKLLVDQTGSLRKALGFPEGVTWVAVYEPGGRLISVESNLGTAAFASNVWRLACRFMEQPPMKDPDARREIREGIR